MAIVFPKAAIKSGTPVEIDKINENFRDIIEETQGSLGEHNWAKDAFSQTADVTEGAIVRSYRTSQSVEWYEVASTYSGSVLQQDSTSGPRTLPTNAYKVSNSHFWEVIKSAGTGTNPMEITLTTGHAALWIVFSCQMEFSSSTDLGSGFGLGTNLPGFQIAIAVDGAVVPETTTGSLDPGNEVTGEGIGYLRTPLAIDCVYPVLPGRHTISVQARMVFDKDRTRYNSDDDFYAVFNSEMFIMEMR
tara:strand:- start:10678 stop:11415 length:738 start_codon:yes stop_codon:yes gene_type:complete